MSIMFIVFICLFFILFFLSWILSFLIIKRIFLKADERINVSNKTWINVLLLTLIPIIGILYISPKYFLKNIRLGKNFTIKTWLGIYVIFILIAYLFLIVSRGFLITSFISPMKIFWSAMSPTLTDWGYYTSIQTYTSIKRWDIVYYKIDWIALTPRVGRIVWLPDETIGFSDGNIYLLSNTGSKLVLNESYLPDWTKTFITWITWIKEFKIPSDSYFIIWDNRANSSDSRYCFYSWCDEIHKNPYVNQNSIVGKIY